MNGRFASRLAASCGALSVLLFVVGNAVQGIGGGSPGPHDSPQEFLAVGKPTTLLVGGFLTVLGSCLFVPFFASLAATLGRADGADDALPAVVLGGGLLTVAMVIVAAAPLAALGVLADDGQLSAEVAKALTLMYEGLFVVAWATSAIYVGATAVLIIRTRVLPRVLGWSGIGLAPGLLAASLVVFKYEAAFVVWPLTLVWIVATSVALAVRAGRPEAAAARGHRVAAAT